MERAGEVFSKNQLNKEYRGHGKRVEKVAHHAIIGFRMALLTYCANNNVFLESIKIDLLKQYNADMRVQAPRKGWRMKKATSKHIFRPKSTDSVRPINVPNHSKHDLMSPGTKFANTGRKAKSFHSPTVMARLQSFQSQLNALRATIHRKLRISH